MPEVVTHTSTSFGGLMSNLVNWDTHTSMDIGKMMLKLVWFSIYMACNVAPKIQTGFEKEAVAVAVAAASADAYRDLSDAVRNAWRAAWLADATMN